MMDMPDMAGQTAMIVTMTTVMVGKLQTVICDDGDDDNDCWDDRGDDFVPVNDGGNDDHDDFGDSDDGGND